MHSRAKQSLSGYFCFVDWDKITHNRAGRGVLNTPGTLQVFETMEPVFDKRPELLPVMVSTFDTAPLHHLSSA